MNFKYIGLALASTTLSTIAQWENLNYSEISAVIDNAQQQVSVIHNLNIANAIVYLEENMWDDSSLQVLHDSLESIYGIDVNESTYPKAFAQYENTLLNIAHNYMQTGNTQLIMSQVWAATHIFNQSIDPKNQISYIEYKI